MCTPMIEILFILQSYFIGNLVETLNKEEVIQSNLHRREDTILMPDDFARVDSFKEIDLKDLGFKLSVEKFVGKFEGDVMLPHNKSIHAFVNDSNDETRAAVRDVWRRWPNGEIPYLISNEYGTYSRQALARAFEEYHKKTCLKFVPRDESRHTDYLFILPEDGCYSFVGRVGGRQTVSLDGGCIQFGTILHELMHAAGHFHEQSRPDRDEYVMVLLENVRPGSKDQFEKYSLRAVNTMNLPYDYGSLMHYGPRTFSRNGLPTLRALVSGGDEQMGQRREFSKLDLQKLNKLYECPEKPFDGTNLTPVAPEWSKAGENNKAECNNYKWHCFFWKWLGYCHKDPDYMLKNCPKKCDMCNELLAALPIENDRTSTSLPLTPKLNNECSDTHGHCTKWVEMGFCHKSSDLMKEVCKKSCGLCDGKARQDVQQSGPCKNMLNDFACNQNAFWGMCTGGKEHMEVNCRKACNMCS